MPIGDGGEGTLEALVSATGGQLVNISLEECMARAENELTDMATLRYFNNN